MQKKSEIQKFNSGFFFCFFSHDIHLESNEVLATYVSNVGLALHFCRSYFSLLNSSVFVANVGNRDINALASSSVFFSTSARNFITATSFCNICVNMFMLFVQFA